MKKETKADIILHPVRMRVVQTLINNRQLTVQQIHEQLIDIPQASLYRHLKKLLDAELVTVVEERQARGAVEKVYALPEQAESISDEEMENAGPEEHMGYFMKFLTTVMADFERYLSQEDFDFKRDRAGYRQASFYATDEEFQQHVETINASLKKLLGNEADGKRKKRTLTTIVTTEHNQKKKKK